MEHSILSQKMTLTMFTSFLKEIFQNHFNFLFLNFSAWKCSKFAIIFLLIAASLLTDASNVNVLETVFLEKTPFYERTSEYIYIKISKF